MAKLGQIKSGTMRVGNTTASGYGIVYADEVIGHRRVNTYAELKTLPAWCLYNKAGGDSINTAIGQLWYVYNGDSSHVAGLYQLVGTDISSDASWKLFKNGADVSTHDTTYTFANGSNGTFTVTPKGGSAQTVSIGKPTTAGTADHATTADTATKATKDANNNDIAGTYLTKNTASLTYATKRDVSALTSALVYKGTVDAKYALPTKNVKIGDVYVVAAAGAFAGQTCEPGDMIIAQTASDAEGTPAPTWTVVQTNINGAVTSTNTLADNTLVLGNNNRAIKASSGSGFVKVINGTVSYNNDVVTASDTLDASKLIIGKGKKNIQTASGTGFVKISDGVVLTDNSTYLTTTSASNTYAKKTDLSSYLTSVPKATTTAVGGGKVVNVYNATAELTNTDPTASNVTLYGLQIDENGNFYTPVKNAATYSLPPASNTVLGGIKTGFTQNNTEHQYPVSVNGSSQAFVKILPVTSDVDGLMSSSDKNKLNSIQYPTSILTSQLDLCGYADYATLVDRAAGQRDGLSFYVSDQNAILTVQTDNEKHAIIQTIRTATTLNNSWEFNTGATSSHTDGVLFTYQRFYPISGTYSADTQNKWTKWAIIDVDTMYTANRSGINTLYKAKGKQLFSNLAVDTDGKITFHSAYSGTNKEGTKLEAEEILTPISKTTITDLF